ncbi:MAG: hypothetical protein IPH93_10075 [Saprospiraceae bacterium]|nr:hypothetical protein [Saprospiraceae bacterium]MBK7812395.1 hypothetical protein [Saprospiraceae bacterium]MBK9632380.1 hypothetical protein [Saprospiraceae bacterium]
MMRSLFGPNRKNREEAFSNLAYELEFQRIDPTSIGLIAQLQQLELFKAGANKKIENLVGFQNYISDKYIFDYSYLISTGKTSHTFHQTVLFIDCRELSLPDFFLKPENFFDTLKEWFGYKDIDFLSHPDFSDDYRLTGEYESVIRYYFSQEILELLTQYKSFWMEASNYYLIIYRDKQLIDPLQLKAFAQFGLMIYELLKVRSHKSKHEFGVE